MGLIIGLHLQFMINQHFSTWFLFWAIINFGSSFLHFFSIFVTLLFWNWLVLHTSWSRLSCLVTLCKWLFKNFFNWIIFNSAVFSNFFFNILGFDGFNLRSYGRRGKLNDIIGVVGFVQHIWQRFGLFDLGFWLSHSLKGCGINIGWYI